MILTIDTCTAAVYFFFCLIAYTIGIWLAICAMLHYRFSEQLTHAPSIYLQVILNSNSQKVFSSTSTGKFPSHRQMDKGLRLIECASTGKFVFSKNDVPGHFIRNSNVYTRQLSTDESRLLYARANKNKSKSAGFFSTQNRDHSEE